MPPKVEDADERIRACTLAEIEKNGIVGLRVANIAKQAGVSVPLVYKLFGDREQLLATVLSESIETFYLTDINNIRALVEKSKTNITVELLLQALPMPSDAFRLKQRKLRMLIFAASYESPKLRKAVGKAQQTIQHATRDLIHLVRERSGSKVDVDEDVIAFAVQAFGFSFSIHDINPDKPLSDATYREFMTDFLNRYLLS
ncbi:MAG: TetR/AcrR family transcriptional regulator [Ilumatobacteraceae bacterium]|jgi:AcrR family transcriptional regulator|nr:TetR/AcrR family transcriptional regulator [Ilumatobacteraceae bacterium]